MSTLRYTYEVAPVFTLAEDAVLQRSLELFGLQSGDGIFAPGMYLMNIARPFIKWENI